MPLLFSYIDRGYDGTYRISIETNYDHYDDHIAKKMTVLSQQKTIKYEERAGRDNELSRFLYDNDLIDDTLINDYEKMKNALCGYFDVTEEEVDRMIKEKQAEYEENKAIYCFERTNKEMSIYLSFEEIMKSVSPNEAKILSLVNNALADIHTKDEMGIPKYTLTSFNGVLADGNNWLGSRTNCIGMIVLLNGKDYYPEVNIARNRVWGFSNKVMYAEGFNIIKVLV